MGVVCLTDIDTFTCTKATAVFNTQDAGLAVTGYPWAVVIDMHLHMYCFLQGATDVTAAGGPAATAAIAPFIGRYCCDWFHLICNNLYVLMIFVKLASIYSTLCLDSRLLQR